MSSDSGTSSPLAPFVGTPYSWPTAARRAHRRAGPPRSAPRGPGVTKPSRWKPAASPSARVLARSSRAASRRVLALGQAHERAVLRALALQPEAAPAEHARARPPSPRARGRRGSRPARASARAGARSASCSRAKRIFARRRRPPSAAPDVGGLHRLVAVVVEAPLEVEVVDALPVALAQRVGEALVDRPARVEAHEVEPAAGLEHGVDHGRTRRAARPSTRARC